CNSGMPVTWCQRSTPRYENGVRCSTKALSTFRQFALGVRDDEKAMRTQFHYNWFIYHPLFMGMCRSPNTSRNPLDAHHDSTTPDAETTAFESRIAKSLMVRTGLCRTQDQQRRDV